MDELVLSIAASKCMNMFLFFWLRNELCQHKGKPKDALRLKSENLAVLPICVLVQKTIQTVK